MKRTDALDRIRQIAGLLTKGVAALKRRPLGSFPLLAWLPVMEHADRARRGMVQLAALPMPDIEEVLVFGSCAGETEDVNDIDLLVVDTGFFSSFFTSQGGPTRGSKEQELHKQLGLLLSGFLDIPREDSEDFWPGRWWIYTSSTGRSSPIASSARRQRGPTMTRTSSGMSLHGCFDTTRSSVSRVFCPWTSRTSSKSTARRSTIFADRPRPAREPRITSVVCGSLSLPSSEQFPPSVSRGRD